MDLWVRSQDREDLIKVDNLGLAYKGKYNFIDNDIVDDKFYICQFTNEFHAKLGSYTTKERALEILNEIEKLFIIHINGSNYDRCDLLIKAKMLPMIYEMPEK